MNPAQILETLQTACSGYAEECIASADYEQERSELDQAFNLISHELQGGKFKVETRTVGEWEDCWTENDGHADIPMRFRTIADAQAEIDDHIHDTKEAVVEGLMDEAHDPNDYRIVPA
jgi:hypothetical protein